MNIAKGAGKKKKKKGKTLNVNVGSKRLLCILKRCGIIIVLFWTNAYAYRRVNEVLTQSHNHI